MNNKLIRCNRNILKFSKSEKKVIISISEDKPLSYLHDTHGKCTVTKTIKKVISNYSHIIKYSGNDFVISYLKRTDLQFHYIKLFKGHEIK